MNPKLQNKINKAITKQAKFGGWSKQLVRGIKREVKKDLILPWLNLRSNARVNFSFPDDKTINLQIGPRDLDFERETGECIGTGTCLF